jgi:DNA-binding transcriptional ArsR family regulator
MADETPRKRATSFTSLESLAEAAEFLRVIAHPHRLHMLQSLAHDRYTVGELAEVCQIPSAVASEHLRLMQRCGILRSEKDGRKVYYLVAEKDVVKILGCVAQRYGNPSARQ